MITEIDTTGGYIFTDQETIQTDTSANINDENSDNLNEKRPDTADDDNLLKSVND